MEKENKGVEIYNKVEEILKEMYFNRKDVELINLSVNWASLKIVEIFERIELYPSEEKELSYNVIIDEVDLSEDKFSYYVKKDTLKNIMNT